MSLGELEWFEESNTNPYGGVDRECILLACCSNGGIKPLDFSVEVMDMPNDF